MEQQHEVSESEKKLIFDLMVVEYQRLSEEIRQDFRNSWAAVSVLAVISGAAVYAAFNNWQNPLVSSILLTVVLPLVVFGSIGAGSISLFWWSRKSDYIGQVLEKRANQLLGASLELWLAQARKGPKQVASSKGAWEPLSRNVWGWDTWVPSEPFCKTYRGGLAFLKFWVGGIFLAVFLIPISAGYVRVFSYEGWAAIGMESVFHWFRLMLLIVPLAIALATSVAFIIGFPMLNLRPPRSGLSGVRDKTPT